MIKQKIKAFTLVELIVVITILAILGTIAFISLQGYSRDSRDSVRVTDLSNINKTLELYILKAGKVPKPENSINITFSGILIGYEGDMGTKTLEKLNIFNGGNDPLDETDYTYFTNGGLTSYQVMGLLEGGDIIGSYFLNNSYANLDLSDRFPFVKGNPLGLLVDENNNPIHRVDEVLAVGEFDMLSTTFRSMLIKPLFNNEAHFTEDAIRWGGQLLTASKNRKYSPPTNCPENFIPVPGNNNLGQPGFCVGKYEASINNDLDTGNGTNIIEGNIDALVTAPFKFPASKFYYSSASSSDVDRCSLNGSGYHTMTTNEWLTIARNIESVGKNWSGLVTGSGYIKTGNSGNAITGLGNMDTIYKTGTGSADDSLRQLSLSNGEVIWDFIGNVFEMVKQSNSSDVFEFNNDLGTYFTLNVAGINDINVHYFEDITDKYFLNHFGPKIGNLSSQGLGSYQGHSNGVHLVGGDFAEITTNENGLYSLLEYGNSNLDKIGIRCVKY